MAKLGWSLFLLLSFIVTLPISWWLLAKIDFGYPFLYQQIGVDQHIERYAPRNIKGKKHFEQTAKKERLALFHGVVKAIQNHGEGLSELSYKDKTTNKKISLFTQAEITHLQDVANLLDKLQVLVLFLGMLWLSIIIILWRLKQVLPGAKQLYISAIILLMISAAILAIGPEAIFNQLHRWVFPDNHQWFFYYEESLMSTMMKAPDLFAYIAVIWACLSFLVTALVLKGLGAGLKHVTGVQVKSEKK